MISATIRIIRSLNLLLSNKVACFCAILASFREAKYTHRQEDKHITKLSENFGASNILLRLTGECVTEDMLSALPRSVSSRINKASSCETWESTVLIMIVTVRKRSR
jgi:hypothetical protein